MILILFFINSFFVISRFLFQFNLQPLLSTIVCFPCAIFNMKYVCNFIMFGGWWVFQVCHYVMLNCTSNLYSIRITFIHSTRIYNTTSGPTLHRTSRWMEEGRRIPGYTQIVVIILFIRFSLCFSSASMPMVLLLLAGWLAVVHSALYVLLICTPVLIIATDFYYTNWIIQKRWNYFQTLAWPDGFTWYDWPVVCTSNGTVTSGGIGGQMMAAKW